MRAHVEVSDSEKKILLTLDPEEREVLVEQMIATLREEVEWIVAVERAHQTATTAASATVRPPPTPSPRPRFSTHGRSSMNLRR